MRKSKYNFNIGDKVVLIKESKFTKKYLSKNKIYKIIKKFDYSDYHIQLDSGDQNYYDVEYFKMYDICKERKKKLQKINTFNF